MSGIDTPQGTFGQTPPTIDVRLVNSGTGTALIVGCDVEVVWARRFTHVRPPVAKDDRSGAALLPPSAHYTVLLPSPEKAVGRSFAGAKAAPHPLERAVRGSDGLNLSHELKAGESDRFVIRAEVEPHGGGTLFDHAMPGDDRLAYQVRLLISYLGGRKTQRLATDKVGIVSPANELRFPAPGEVRLLIDRFRREVSETESEIDAARLEAGNEPFDWARLRSSDALDVKALSDALGGRQSLTSAFLRPDDAVREFLDVLEEFCRSVLTEMPRGSDLADVFSAPAGRALTEVHEVRAEEFG
ncbi:hypothetical protein [Cryptosporangium phraense]|uniref:Uncharacterized protein n=1 Tax=Cryptosporangium phraense TaxID=2593070 RepID=A0A545AL27_9ACTN|nr:hypothetical protein [Cryptosporangium phraense]TQS42023.1 hypothetical protein FL583_25870 [Cryptosporangium phraense]